jgi:hypothetical protein
MNENKSASIYQCRRAFSLNPRLKEHQYGGFFRTQIFDVSCQLLLGALLEASDKCPIKISIQNDGMNIASAADCRRVSEYSGNSLDRFDRDPPLEVR